MLALIPLIPLLPLAGFLVIGLFGRKRLSKQAVATIACGAVLLAFVLSLGAVLDLASGGAARYAGRDGYSVSTTENRFETTVATWIPAGPFVGVKGLADRDGSLGIDYGFQLDPLSAVMILVVTGVGFLIHVYSTGYMAHEEGYARFFTYLNLFMAMMLTLVLANNFLLMFVGWEGVGLCSYLLIGFFTDRVFDVKTGVTCSDAGRKAFITNRIGDFAFVLGVLLLLFYFHTADISDVMGAINAGSAGLYGSTLMTAAGILLFVGACGKSAQIPLYVWLPDAMAGPTPVSALIHAATMVTAGVYMLARTSALFWHAPGAMLVVATIGCATAIFAATMGLAQTDIKKVLAYSTVSQLGFMFLGAGVGAFVAAIFHLMTHAFFKACLFLGSGSVIHGMGGEQDVRRMGGLRKQMPVTYKTFLISTLAIAGIFPFAGFFSKDEILFSAVANARGRWLFWAVGSTAALCTAFYMFRLVYLTFHGSFRGTHEQEHHLHESPRSMTVPLLVLASLSCVGGLIGIPAFMTGGLIPNLFERWLHPTVAYHGASLDQIEEARRLETQSIGVPVPPSRWSAHPPERALANERWLVTELALVEVGALTEGSELGGGERSSSASECSEHGPPFNDREHARRVRAHSVGIPWSWSRWSAHPPERALENERWPVLELALVSERGSAPAHSRVQALPARVPSEGGARSGGEPQSPHEGAAHGTRTEGEPRGEHARVKPQSPHERGEQERGGGVETAQEFPAAAEWGLVGFALLVALAGWMLARQMYIVRPELPAAVAARAGAIHRLVREKYYVDELYDLILLRPFYAGCRLFHAFDVWVVDGAVNGARHATIGLSHLSSFYDRWVVDLAVNGVGWLVRGVSFVLRRAQTGVVQNYAAAMVLGAFVLLGIYLIVQP